MYCIVALWKYYTKKLLCSPTMVYSSVKCVALNHTYKATIIMRNDKFAIYTYIYSTTGGHMEDKYC